MNIIASKLLNEKPYESFFFARGNIENAEIFTKFCPSYKKACVQERWVDTREFLSKLPLQSAS